MKGPPSAPTTPSKSTDFWSRIRGSTQGKSASPVVRSRKQGKASKAEVHRLEASPWLGTLVLGLWDNTCGPRIDQVWLGTSEPVHDDELLSYAVRLTLASEIGHQSSSLTQKFHLFSELSTMIISTSFGVFEGSFKYALIVLCDSALLPRYLQLADVVQDRMFRLASGIQQLLERQLPAAAHVPLLRRFVAQIDALFAAPQPQLLTLTSQPPPAALLESGFFALLLTAHIQAGCRTAVCCSGAPESAVTVLHALQPFALKQQFPLHRLSVATSHVPDLALQGVLLPASNGAFTGSGVGASSSLSSVSSVPMSSPVSGAASSPSSSGDISSSSSSSSGSPLPPLDDATLFQSIRPCAVVALHDSGSRVFAAAPAPEYAVMRREHVAGEIARLSSGAPDPPPAHLALRVLRRPAPWCVELAMLLARLPSSLRHGAALARFRALQLRALALVKSVSAVGLERAVLGPLSSSSLSSSSSASHSAHSSSHASSSSSLPMAPSLDAQLSPDFLLLLGLADAMAPGTYMRLAGDPDALESKFFELFDSF